MTNMTINFYSRFVFRNRPADTHSMNSLLGRMNLQLFDETWQTLVRCSNWADRQVIERIEDRIIDQINEDMVVNELREMMRNYDSF